MKNEKKRAAAVAVAAIQPTTITKIDICILNAIESFEMNCTFCNKQPTQQHT